MLLEPRQLLLPFEHHFSYDVRDFVAAGSNQAALAWLDTEWPDRRLVLWGPPGCGKTHLLHVWATRTGAQLLHGRTLKNFYDLPASGGVALDQADAIASEPILLHLLNTARDRGLRLLLSGQTAPSRWPASLPDLSSRLRAISAAEIYRPNDELLATLLIRLLADRQLTMSRTVQDWLLLQIPKCPGTLREIVARLDRASLMFGSGITRSLVLKVLSERDLNLENDDESYASALDPGLCQARLI
jgi:chromosomal replication initiation ATPase DnaA